MPHDVRAFLREAERRIKRFQRSKHLHGFVASDYVGAYRVLDALARWDSLSGRMFCEWGSGFGVVACLAAMLDYDAFGIEIEDDLIDRAERLVSDFDLAVEFLHGSFIPRNSRYLINQNWEYDWLESNGCDAYEQSGLHPEDFAVFFVYPWPGEENLTEQLFDHCAAVGAVLVSFCEGEDVVLRRKTAQGGQCE